MDKTITTTHTSSGVSPTVQAASVTYLCDFFGSGSAQLEVSKDGGETWLSADAPVRASMEVFVESHGGDANAEWRMNVVVVTGNIQTHLTPLD